MVSQPQKAKIQFPLSQKVLALVLIPLVVSSGLLLVLAMLLRQAEFDAERESHAKEMRGQCTIVLDYADTSVKSLVNFVLTKDRDYLLAVTDAEKHLQSERVRLAELAKNNPQQEESVRTICFLLDRIATVSALAAKGLLPGDNDLANIWQSADQMKIEVRKINIYESRVRGKGPHFESEFRGNLKLVLLYGSALNFLVAILLCIFAMRAVLRRLLRLLENYKRLAKQEALIPESKGNDEISQMEQGFHEMARSLAEYVRKEQAMIENANDIICSLDSGRRFLRINRACLEILGYENSEICNHLVDEFIAEGNVEKSIAAIDSVVESRSSGKFEVVMNCKDASSRVLLWTAHWADQDQALFCVLHDITELKRLERTKQDFLAMVSHDLRAPLMSIQATLEMLEDNMYGELTSIGSSAVNSSQRNLIYLLQFVEQILDIEKFESGRFKLSRKEKPIQAVLDRAEHLVDDLAEKLGVRLDLGRSSELAYIDEDRMIQVIVNLLSNAIKFAPKESTVVLTVEKNAAAEVVEIRVSDRGRGIPAGMEKIIFDRFQQVSHSDWTEKKGSGLGLAICKLIVEAHDGSIGVESIEGQGSTFWLKLPCKKPANPGSTSDALSNQFRL